MKKLTAFLLSAVLCLSLLCGCGENTDRQSSGKDETEKDKSVFSVCLCGEDNLNPILTGSMNNYYVLRLCYDGLVSVTDKGVEPTVAEDYEYKDNIAVFKLRSDAAFADGTPITSDDIYYSYDLARKEGSAYASRFSYITDFSKTDDTFRVSFSEYAPDNMRLCDIPIVKKNSSGPLPVGSGRYTPSYTEDGNKFVANEHCMRGKEMNIKEIYVVTVSDANEIPSLFSAGKISAVYSDLLSDKTEYNGNFEIREFTSSVLTFLGFASGFSGYSAEQRKILSSAIPRSDLVKKAISGAGEPAYIPFSNNFDAVSKLLLGTDIYSDTLVNDYLSGSNYFKRDIKILYNLESNSKEKTAEYLKDNFAAFGINADLISVKFSLYNAMILSGGGFDMYIGSVKLPPNMSIRALSDYEVNINAGEMESLNSEMAAYYAGGNGLSEALMNFTEKSVIIPLYFSKCALIVNRKVSGDFSPNESDIFCGIETFSLE